MPDPENALIQKAMLVIAIAFLVGVCGAALFTRHQDARRGKRRR
jgi:hypothetical protein